MALTVAGSAAEEGAGVKGPIEADLEQADLFALLDHQVDGFFGNFGAGTHKNDDALGVGCAVVIEETIGAAGLRGEAVHDRLHDAGNGLVVWSAGFARLEEDVGILRGAADEWGGRA